MVRLIAITPEDSRNHRCIKCGSTESVKYKVTSSMFDSTYFCCNKCCFDVKAAVEKTELDHINASEEK